MYKFLVSFILLINFSFAEDITENIESTPVDGKIAYEELGTLSDGFLFSNSENTDFEVLYFFSYSCPSCFRFSPILEEWKDNNIKDNISFRSVPVTFQEYWRATAKAFFIGNLLNIETDSIYDYHHVDRNFIIADQDVVRYFVEQHGFSEDELTPYIKSSEVENAIDQAMNIADQFEIPATPFFVVIDNESNVYRVSHRTSNTDLGVVLSLTYLTKPELRPIFEGGEP
jgi:thiol-disulfide isomerase/thioredoxin